MNMAENMRQESAMANLRQSHETLQRWKFLVAGGNKVCERDVRRAQAEVDVAISLAEKAGISAEEIAEVTGAKPPATKLREEISRLQQQAASSEAEAVIAWKEAGILAAEVCRLEAALAVAVTEKEEMGKKLSQEGVSFLKGLESREFEVQCWQWVSMICFSAALALVCWML